MGANFDQCAGDSKTVQIWRHKANVTATAADDEDRKDDEHHHRLQNSDIDLCCCCCAEDPQTHKCPPSRRRAAVVNSNSHRLNNWPAHANTRNGTSRDSGGVFANCYNYNAMCQLYKSINSREKLPIIKRSQLWNTFTRNLQLNYSQFFIRAVIVILLLCPNGCWSWTVSRDTANYQQTFDYSGKYKTYFEKGDIF